MKVEINYDKMYYINEFLRSKYIMLILLFTFR